MKKLIVLSLLTLNVNNAICQFNTAYPYVAGEKKVIEMGWDQPSASWMKDNMASMEQMPFDGVVFTPASKVLFPWELTNWETTGRIDTASLSAIKWGKLKYSFMNLWTGDHSGFSYFNDSHWDVILANMRYYARLAKQAGIPGICFDTENYSPKCPWSSIDHAEGHSVAETKAKVRERGAQMMAAWQGEYPDIKILCMFLFRLAPPAWDMLPDFVNGMLDSINTTAMLIEGDEFSYYPKSTKEFFDCYTEVKSKYRDAYCAPENYRKYASNVQVAKAMYDQVVINAKSSVEQKQQWEHNAHIGLVTADEYVWVYVEGFSWWNNPDHPNGADEISYPPWAGAKEGIVSAISKYRSQQRLGWDMVGGSVDSSVTVSLVSSATEVPETTGTVTLTVGASGDAITRIDLYQNMQKIQSSATSPAIFKISNMLGGKYEFVAHVTAANATGTSNPVIVNVDAATNSRIAKTTDIHKSDGNINSVKSISVNPTSASLVVNGIQQLSIVLSPSNAANNKVSWNSSDTGVVKVNANGLVTAVAAGKAIITVTAQDGGKIATSEITVPYTCGILKTPFAPIINGDINEFVNADSAVFNIPSGAKASVKVLWDDTALYFAAKITDTQLNADVTVREGAIWDEDTFEIVIDNANDQGVIMNEDDYQFLVNMLNTQCDLGAGNSAAWNGTWQSAVVINGTNKNNTDVDSGYTLELSIPWKIMGYTTSPKEGKVVGLDFTIDDKRATGKSAIQWPGNTYNFQNPSAWQKGILLGTFVPAYRKK